MPDPPNTKPKRVAALLGGSLALTFALVVYFGARDASESLSKHGKHVAMLQHSSDDGVEASQSGAATPGEAAAPRAPAPPGSPAEAPPTAPADRSLGVLALPLMTGDAATPPRFADAAAPPSDAGAGADEADAGVDASVSDTPTFSPMEELAEPPLVGVELGLTQCGRLTCMPGYECCCEACVPRSEGCNDPSCPASSSLSLSVPCGMMLCDPGQVCCDAACGACARFGECPERPCE